MGGIGRLEERQNQFSLAGEDGWKGRERGGFFPFQLTVQPVLLRWGGIEVRKYPIRHPSLDRSPWSTFVLWLGQLNVVSVREWSATGDPSFVSSRF